MTDWLLQDSSPDLPVVILALLYDGLVVAGSAEERLASLACEGPEVEACRWFLTYPTLLVLQRVYGLQLKTQQESQPAVPPMSVCCRH